MEQYTGFVPQNIAPPGVRRIGIYNSDGKWVGCFSLGNLKPPDNIGQRTYAFGALADVHYSYETGAADFARALKYLAETEGVAFTCICGDLTSGGTAAQLASYKASVDANSPNTPVYAITGNHEGYNSGIASIIETYTGHPLYYSFEYDGDVFIMVGIKSSTNGALFADGELQWLYETLEANRNKRCFVFQHVRPQDACGNAFGIYNYDIWGGTEQTVFESLLRHYRNVILFHGHSHLKYDLQREYGEGSNIDKVFGVHSIHLSSITVPRDGDPSGASSRVEVYAESEGTIVDVYPSGIMLRARDFVRERLIPLGTYWLDTTLQTVEAGTYTDSTGTIATGSAF
jgi:predicted phosphodiesterase